MTRSPDNNDQTKVGKAKLSHPDAFLDELDGDQTQDPDKLLAEVAPHLDQEMNQLRTDFSGLTLDIETLDLDGDGQEELPVSFKERWLTFKKRWKNKIQTFASWAFYHIKYLIIWLMLEAPKKILAFLRLFFGYLKDFYGVYASWSRRRKVLFFLASSSLIALTVIYYQMIKSKVLYRETYHFWGTMAEVADYTFKYAPEAGFEPFYNSPRVKSYSFQMKPVVVNLRRNASQSNNPMGFFEFIFEGSSGDVVAEIKERESEFVDLVERVIEAQTYESLETVDGKDQLKEDLRREMNKQLTEGLIRKVDISNIFIKP